MQQTTLLHLSGIVGLKIAVENTLVKGRFIELYTSTDWLLFADTRTCPMLKEHATDYFDAWAKDVLAHELSKKLKESQRLMEELMLATFNNTHTVDNDLRVKNLSVNELRVQQ